MFGRLPSACASFVTGLRGVPGETGGGQSETGGGSAIVISSETQQLWRERTRQGPLDRTICDYVAGMTDRYAIEIYAEYFASALAGLKV